MSTHETKKPPIIVVGGGARARAWTAALRTGGAELVAGVARLGSDALVLPSYEVLGPALAAYPDALVAVALPPRASLAAALVLAGAGRRGLVAAPLHPAVADLALPRGADLVQVAHGFVTLGGRAPFERLLATRSPERLSLEVRGLPDAAEGDLEEVLVHALALLRRLAPAASVRAVRAAGDAELTIDLAGPFAIALRVHAHGSRIDAHARGAFGEVRWLLDGEHESIERTRPGGKPETRVQRPCDAPLRAAAQLFAEPGDTLADAAVVQRLTNDVLRQLPRRPPTRRAFRQARRLSEERPKDVLAQLGLEGPALKDETTDARGSVPPNERIPRLLPPAPIELWSFRAGQQPVVFLTLAPAAVDRAVALFGDVHVERRERRVDIGALDHWNDRRDRGEVRVEVYLSREPALAKEAARLQADGDPSAHLREIGALLGYPACCVEAFAAQRDRADNTFNRYASAARTPPGAPWPFELDNLADLLVPFYPCSYTCPHALAQARRALKELCAAHPLSEAPLREHLARPILYFAHDRFVSFDGACDGRAVDYTRVFAPRDADRKFLSFVSELRGGGRLTFDEDTLRVDRSGGERLSYARTDPGLGFLAPFAAS